MDFTIALDLEGTLITDEKSRIPRPGLYDFLEACRDLGRVVQYTMVDEETVREIARELVDSGHAPEWYADIEWVDWFSVDTDHKDLNLIPGASVKNAVLVDDHMGFVAPGQEHRWIKVDFFDPSISDRELNLALWRIKRQYWKSLGLSQVIDLTWPGDKDKLINDLQDEIDELLQDVVRLQRP
ncbi:MAG: hypothetical protein HUN04_06010 [Desulfobacter sp.]|nr:MAG: hypothetical protein HUN04_06010 [Desulfobacter sp.]